MQSFQGKYNKVILVVGSDQVPEFEERMTPYAKEWGFDFEIVSAGYRDLNPFPYGTTSAIEGMSSTKMRGYAIQNNWKEFNNGLPDALNGISRRWVFEQTKRGMKKSK